MNQKLTLFLTLAILGLLLLDITLIGAYVLFTQYGSLTLSPGEKYTVNIPFVGPSKNPMICGKAEQTDGTALEGIKIIANYSNNTFAGEATTDDNGRYCITLPEITTLTKTYNIYLEYDNSTLTLANHDYDLDFENNRIYSKGSNEYVFLTGNITNEYAEIENGRFEINLQYWPVNSSERYEIFDYRKYSVNISSNEIYEVPNSELNVSWQIPSDAEIGTYKFYIKTSFNAKERTSNIYFNITE
jgi:hypothetical protein